MRMNDETMTSPDETMTSSDIDSWLTYDGQDDDHKVEDVPADGEVVLPERDDLQSALCGEDDDEDEVDPVQDIFFLYALLVCLHHHGHHVEAD